MPTGDIRQLPGFYKLSPEAQATLLNKHYPGFSSLSPEGQQVFISKGRAKIPEDIGMQHLQNLAQSQPTDMQALGQFGEAAWEGLKHVGGAFGNITSGLTPLSLAQGEIARQRDLSKASAEAPSSYEKAGMQLSRIPVIGAMGQAAGEAVEPVFAPEVRPRQVGKTFGEQVIPAALTSGILKGAGAYAKRVTPGINQLPRAVDEVAKAFGATKASQLESLAEAHPVVHHELAKAGAVYDNIGTEGYLRGTKAAEKSLFKEEFEPNLQKFGHNLEPVSPVAERIRSSISEGTGEVRPGLKEAIDKTANRYQDKHWSLNKIYETQKELRKEIDGINSAPNRSELLGKPTNAAKLKELDALTDIMTDRLSALSGKDFSKARYRYKALKDTEEMARNANDRVAAMDAAERATKHPLATDLLNAKGVYEAGAKLVKRTVAKKLADPNHPNALIGSSLKRLGGKSQRPPIAGAKGQAAIPFSGQGIEQSSVEGEGPLFTSAKEGYRKTAQQLENLPTKSAQKALPPATSTVQPSTGGPIEGRAAGAEPIKLGPTKQYQGPTPIVEHPPEEGIRLPEHGGAYGPTGSSKITPPSLRQRLKSERGSFSRKPITPEGEGPYANKPGPVEPDMSMENFLNLHNISPEAQRFLGYNKPPANVSIPPPPTKAPIGPPPAITLSDGTVVKYNSVHDYGVPGHKYHAYDVVSSPIEGYSGSTINAPFDSPNIPDSLETNLKEAYRNYKRGQ